MKRQYMGEMHQIGLGGIGAPDRKEAFNSPDIGIQVIGRE